MRQGKKVLVWAVAVVMVADSALACRWRQWSFRRPVNYGPAYYEADCCNSGYEVVVNESSCDAPADCLSCEGVTTEKVPADSYETVPYESSEPAPSQSTLDQDLPPAPPKAAPVEKPPAKPTPEKFVPPAIVPSAPAPQSVTPPPAQPTPSAPAPSSATAPQPAAPSSEVEDLFSQPDTTPIEPQTKPAAPNEVEDLFKEPEAAPAKPADEVEDLFKDLDTPSGNKAAASDTPAATPMDEPSKEIEDLFSEPTGPMATVELEATPAEPEIASATNEPTDGMRVWTDNTGRFQIRARLVVVGKSHVRLLKDTGKFTTVPYSRLSQTDLAYVRTQTDASKVAGF